MWDISDFESIKRGYNEVKVCDWRCQNLRFHGNRSLIKLYFTYPGAPWKGEEPLSISEPAGGSETLKTSIRPSALESSISKGKFQYSSGVDFSPQSYAVKQFVCLTRWHMQRVTGSSCLYLQREIMLINICYTGWNWKVIILVVGNLVI